MDYFYIYVTLQYEDDHLMLFSSDRMESLTWRYESMIRIERQSIAILMATVMKI